MTPAVDGTQLVADRTPGDFHRKADGSPRVAHPTQMLKDGSRPAWTYYGRPSALGKKIGDSYRLSLYQQRMVAKGFVVNPSLIDQAAALADLTNDDAEFRTLGDTIARAAQDAAKASLAADRGTHTHALTEDHDTDADPIARLERGEALGLTADVQRSLIATWRQFLDHYGLEVLATEAQIVNDALRVAGTLDRIVRATRDITIGYEVVPAGTVFVLDIKTGKLRLDDRTGKPMWWHDYAIQIFAYASGRPYDTATDTRGEWPWPIDQRIAAICHLDVRAAMEGNPTARLVLVDLAAGAVGADLVREVDAWGDRTDLFVLDEAITTTTKENYDGTADHDGYCRDDRVASGDEESDGVGDGVRVARAGDIDCRSSAIPDAGTLRPDRAAELSQVPTGQPDEGDRPHDLEVETWRTQYQRVNAENKAAASWMSNLVAQAQAAGVSFHMKESVGGKVTRRRLSILAGMLRMVAAGEDNDDSLRTLLVLTFGEDWPLFANVTPGHALGLLDADQAAIFAAHADVMTRGVLNQSDRTPAG